MKKNFLPTSLLLVIITLAQINLFANGDEKQGKYITRANENSTTESYFADLRANQETGLVDPADLINAQNSANASKVASDLNWTNIGPDNFGGMVSSIIFPETTNPNLIMIGTMGAGIYASINGGITWQNVVNDLMVSCMTLSGDQIYFGTGDGKNAYQFANLNNLGYTNSFIGSGIYSMNVDGSNFVKLVDANTNTWAQFVNEIAVDGTTLYAATDEALMSSTDNGSTWTQVIAGNAASVKVSTNGTVFASIDGNFYRKLVEETTLTMITSPVNGTCDYMKFAIAPSDANIVYVSYITNGFSKGIFVSLDNASENSWITVLPAADNTSLIHNIYDGYGVYNNAITVFPNNPYHILIGTHNIWELQAPDVNDIQNGGLFIVNQVSDGSLYNFSPLYVHFGSNDIVFVPNSTSEFFVGTRGGIFKGVSSPNTYTFSNCNRYIIDETSSSTARFLAVGATGDKNKVLGGSIDHGSIFILGDSIANTISQGVQVYPQSLQGIGFDYDFASASCAYSVIDQNAFFVTTSSGILQRSQTLGNDYDISNFFANTSLSHKLYKMPIALVESFDDQNSYDSVWFKADREYAAHEMITAHSDNYNYPFEYELQVALGSRDSITVIGDTIVLYDSIKVKDVVTSRLYVAIDGRTSASFSPTPKVYMTRHAIQFNKPAEWYNIGGTGSSQASVVGSKLEGSPLSVAVSADGNTMFMGTIEGKLFRITNLNDIVSANTGNISYSSCVVRIKNMNLSTTQAVTSIAVNPNDPNEVMITLGNYGNTSYVYYSQNALDSVVTFTNVQGNLPLMPVYSSIIEDSTGMFIIGTEHGIYTAETLNANTQWTSNGIGDIPVFDLKQQNILKNNVIVNNFTSDGTPYDVVYPGTNNFRGIYAATCGKGLYRCDNFLTNPYGVGITEFENNSDNNTSSLRMYPNPVVDQVNMVINVDANFSMVNYNVYDLSGKMVKSDVLGNYSAGEHTLNVNLGELNSGMYIMQVQVGAQVQTAKFLVR